MAGFYESRNKTQPLQRSKSLLYEIWSPRYNVLEFHKGESTVTIEIWLIQDLHEPHSSQQDSQVRSGNKCSLQARWQVYVCMSRWTGIGQYSPLYNYTYIPTQIIITFFVMSSISCGVSWFSPVRQRIVHSRSWRPNQPSLSKSMDERHVVTQANRQTGWHCTLPICYKEHRHTSALFLIYICSKILSTRPLPLCTKSVSNPCVSVCSGFVYKI